LTIVKIRDDEPFEAVLRRFKRKCIRDGIFSEVRKRRFHEKPSIKKRRKTEAAKRLAVKNRAVQR